MDFFGFFDFFFNVLDFLWIFCFLGFLSKLLMLLLKVTKVTTGHQKLLKMGQNTIITSFFARRAKKASAEGRSPPQEPEVGRRSGPYLLVIVMAKMKKADTEQSHIEILTIKTFNYLYYNCLR